MHKVRRCSYSITVGLKQYYRMCPASTTFTNLEGNVQPENNLMNMVLDDYINVVAKRIEFRNVLDDKIDILLDPEALITYWSALTALTNAKSHSLYVSFRSACSPSRKFRRWPLLFVEESSIPGELFN